MSTMEDRLEAREQRYIDRIARLTRDVTNAMDAVAELERDLAAVRAERDGLAKALRGLLDATTSTPGINYRRIKARAALDALPTPPKEDEDDE